MHGFAHGLRSTVAYLAGVAVLGMAAACMPAPDANSGGDDTRVNAAVVELGAVVGDSVSRKDGDATDWKKFTMAQAGRATVEVFWDDPDLEARLELRNALGAIIVTHDHEPGDASDQVSADLEPGDYFLAIVAESGASVYSLKITAGAGLGGAGHADPRPE